MLNDYMEQQWLVNKAIQHLKVFRKSSHQNLIKLLREILKSKESPYISCFSSEPDLLSQWRAYSDDGAGYAIGFSRIHIETIISSINLGLSLVPINYDEHKQEEMISPMVETLQEILDKYKKEKSFNPKSAIVRLGSKIRNLAIGCKNPGFSEEKEWRIVYNQYLFDVVPWTALSGKVLSTILFRNNNSRIVPYFSLAFPTEAITEIRLGPKNFARNDRNSLRSLLIASGFKYRNVKIINSEASYR
jgi:hypothetical protein